jgi:hypothetical protein
MVTYSNPVPQNDDTHNDHADCNDKMHNDLSVKMMTDMMITEVETRTETMIMNLKTITGIMIVEDELEADRILYNDENNDHTKVIDETYRWVRTLVDILIIMIRTMTATQCETRRAHSELISCD